MAEVGRPSKLTPETVKKLEEAFAIDATVEEACFYADISRQTYYEWIKQNPKLADRFEALRQRPVLTARQAVVRSLNNPDYAFRYLERKRKDEFAQRVENTGKDGKDLSMTPAVINIIKPSDVELQTVPEAIPGVALPDGQTDD